MWEDALKSHFTKSEFRIVRVSTEVFQTVQSLPSGDGLAQAIREFKRRVSHPRHLNASHRSASLPFVPFAPLVYTLPKCILLVKENLTYPAEVAISRSSFAM